MRCLNCGLRVQRIQRHVVTTLPQELQTRVEHFPLEDLICHACFVVLQNADENTPRILGHAHFCVGCGCSLTGIRFHHLEENATFLEYFPWIRSIQNRRSNYEVCHSCWRRASRQSAQDAHREIMQEDSHAVIPPAPAAPPQGQQRPIVIERDTVYLPHYKRAANTSRHCIYSNCANISGHLIPRFIKKMLLSEHNLYVPRSARVCQHHLYANTWHSLPEETSTISSFGVHQIEDLIDTLKQDAVTFDFECVKEMPNHICHYWTGLEISEFLALLNELALENRVQSPKTSMAIFLIKLRTGDSNQRLSSLFNMPRSTMERHMNIVRSCFMEHFVPLHIGLQRLTRQDVIRRNLRIPNAFFGNNTNQTRPAITICDGTCIYIEKSSNYFYQKETYSLHKLNLVKPFLLVCTDGHIIDAIGPYAATQTDADIMKDLFRDEAGPMRTFYSEGDVVILDRGFRDAIPLLEACNYNVQRPESLNEGEHQLTTIQANKSRLVTLCRWVVEVVNGRFKRDYKLFRQEFFNKAHAHLMQDFKIAAALINRFHPTIQDRSDAHLIIERAMRYLNTPNYLSQFVSDYNLNRRSVMFRRIDAGFPQLNFFPVFNYSDLILFALGPYQVKQARSYYGEHIRQNGLYEIELCPELEHSEEMVAAVGGNRPYLLRGRIKSRHVGRRKYFTYILIDA